MAHHINHTIPHYHAKEATEALKEAFPDLYLYDPTPIVTATWRCASRCTSRGTSGCSRMRGCQTPALIA